MSLRNIGRLTEKSVRQFSSTPVAKQVAGEVHPGYKQLREKQAKFQAHDGKPIHLKGGALDAALFGLTVVGCVVGMGGITKLIYELSVPQTNE